MADWSQLPQELDVLIARCLETRFDILRFRSVCSSWRSSVPPKVYSLPTYIPSGNIGGTEYPLSHITINTFYLVRSSQGNQMETPACWLVKTSDGTDCSKTRKILLNPLSDSEHKPLPGNFPKVLDLTRFHVFELGHEYVAGFKFRVHTLFPKYPPRYAEYERKVVFLRSRTNSDDFIILTLFGQYYPWLGFFRSGEKNWIMLQSNYGVQDIISFNGKFYSIEGEGRTKVIDQSLNVSFLKNVFSPERNKFLVKSVDDLLVVEMLMKWHMIDDQAVGFRVFRMNEEEQKWDKMESLGDRILFLGARQAISAPASEFGSGKGNLIFYPKGLSGWTMHAAPSDGPMYVFDLETGINSPLENYPAYYNLFSPLPRWITYPEEQESSISKRNFRFCCFL